MKESEETALVLSEANQELAGTLLPWQEKLCRLITSRSIADRRTPVQNQAILASEWAGRPVSKEEVKQLQETRAWRRLNTEIRALATESLNQAKADLMEFAPEAVATQIEAIRDVRATKDWRALPPLTNKILDLAAPKKELSETVATHLHIHLTAEQAKGLAQPIFEVSAEEVRANIIDGDDPTTPSNAVWTPS